MNVSISSLSDKVSQAFNFEVVKLPLFAPDNQPTGYYGLFRDDKIGTDAVVGSGSVTKRYVPHTTEDVLALVEAASNVFEGEVSLQCHFNHGHYVSVRPSREYRREVYGNADAVWPDIWIKAGYNMTAFEGAIGTYRDLCDNLAMMKMVKGTSVSIRHTSSLRDKMTDLIDTFGQLKQGWDNLVNVIDHLQNREVELTQFLLDIYGTPDETSKNAVTHHKNRIEKILKRIQRERFQSGRQSLAATAGKVSAWEAWNGVQGFAQHDCSRKNKPTGFQRALLASRDRYVKRAEEQLLSLVPATA